jgi:hypothetical protein
MHYLLHNHASKSLLFKFQMQYLLQMKYLFFIIMLISYKFHTNFMSNFIIFFVQVSNFILIFV